MPITDTGWVSFERLTKQQLVSTAGALEDQRDRMIRRVAQAGAYIDECIEQLVNLDPWTLKSILAGHVVPERESRGPLDE